MADKTNTITTDATTQKTTQKEPARPAVAALCRVMASVGRIPKRGRNAFHGYDYATEADIVDHVRDAMAREGLLMVTDIEDITISAPEVVPGEKRPQAITLIRMNVTFVHAESGDGLRIKWAGSGQDSGEKGLYKAMTGGEKYALLKTLLIPTGDDPEKDRDGEGSERPPSGTSGSASRAQKPAPTTAAKPASAKPTTARPDVQATAASTPNTTTADFLTLTTAQQERLKALMKQHKVKATDVKALVEKAYPIASAADIRQVDYDDLCAWVIAGGK